MLICHLTYTFEALVKCPCGVLCLDTDARALRPNSQSHKEQMHVQMYQASTPCQDINQWVPGGAVAKAPGCEVDVVREGVIGDTLLPLTASISYTSMKRVNKTLARIDP